MSEIEAKKRKKAKRGRPAKHGGFSIIAGNELPENRKYIRRYLTAVREGLIEDLGPTEGDLTTAQRILIDRVVSKLGVLRCIEEFVCKTEVMVGDEVASCLKASYLAYNNSIRLDLLALGIDKRAAESVLMPYEIMELEKKRTSEE